MEHKEYLVERKILIASLLINVALIVTLFYVTRTSETDSAMELTEKRLEALKLERDSLKKKEQRLSLQVDSLQELAEKEVEVRYVNNVIYEEAKLNINYLSNDSLSRFLADRLSPNNNN